MAEEQGGVTVNAGPYSGVDYTTDKNATQRKLLSEEGQQRISAEDQANAAVAQAAAANLQPLGAENPVQAEDPFLPDGSENPNYKWDAPPPDDRPSFVEAQDIEAQKRAKLTAEANQQAAAQQAALQQQAAKQAEEWANRIMADADDLAKVSDPRKLMADPRGTGPRRWLQTIMIGLNNGANIVAGGSGPGALQQQINHDLDLDMQRKKLALNAVLQRAQQNGASADALAEIQKKGGDRIEATRQALLKRFESDTMAALSAYPQHKQAAMMELAKVNQANAKRMSDLVTERTGVNKEHERTTVTGDKGTAAPTNAKESVEALEAARQKVSALNEFQNIIRNNPESWKQFQDFNREQAEAEEADKGVTGALRNIGKSIGVVPITTDQRFAGEEYKDVRRLNMLWPIIQTAQARVIDPVGAINETSQQTAKKHVNLLSMPAEEAIAEAEFFKSHAAGTHKAMSELAIKPTRQEGSPRIAKGKPGLDLAKAVAKLPDSLQKTIWKSLKSSDPKTRDAAFDYLQKVGAGQ
jgi:hypothetical protein